MATSRKFVAGQAVKVVALKQLTRKFSGSQGVLRQPAVGDIGEVVQATNPADDSVAQVVEAEMIEAGKVVWHAQFSADELAAADVASPEA